MLACGFGVDAAGTAASSETPRYCVQAESFVRLQGLLWHSACYWH